jgi:hypothetical protein
MTDTPGAVTPVVTRHSDDPDSSDLDRLAASIDELELHFCCGPDKLGDSPAG